MNVAAVALICSNCALRSGCAVPSRAFCSACSRKPSPCSSRPTVDALTGQPWTVNAPASFAVLLQVQRNGDIGSPRVAGSIKITSASVSPGLDLFDARPPGARSTNAPTEWGRPPPTPDARCGSSGAPGPWPTTPRHRPHTRAPPILRPPTAGARAHRAAGPSPRTWPPALLRESVSRCTVHGLDHRRRPAGKINLT